MTELNYPLQYTDVTPVPVGFILIQEWSDIKFRMIV